MVSISFKGLKQEYCCLYTCDIGIEVEWPGGWCRGAYALPEPSIRAVLSHLWMTHFCDLQQNIILALFPTRSTEDTQSIIALSSISSCRPVYYGDVCCA